METQNNPPLENLSMHQEHAKEKSIVLGILGAAVAALVGMMVWFYLIKWTGYEIGYAAWGVGFLTGLGARLLGCNGSTTLGIFAGTCAFIAIVGGQYLAVKHEGDKYFDQFARESYDRRMAFANEAIAAKSDAEIKALLTKTYSTEDGEEASKVAVTDEDVAEFRESELPALKDFIAGKPSKQEFEKSILQFKNGAQYNFIVLKESVGLFTLLWLFLGVGSAFKIAAANSDDSAPSAA